MINKDARRELLDRLKTAKVELGDAIRQLRSAKTEFDCQAVSQILDSVVERCSDGTWDLDAMWEDEDDIDVSDIEDILKVHRGRKA